MSSAEDKEIPVLDFAEEAVKLDPILFEETSLTEPVFARHVLTSPLHVSVARASKTNLWEEWNGVTTSSVLFSTEQEYAALHGFAGMSDISPVAKYRISGRDVTAYLSRLLTDDVSTLSIHRNTHVVFCEERGHVVGDGELFRLDEVEYRLVTHRQHLSWLLDNVLGLRVKVEDVSASIAAIRIAGARARAVLTEAGFENIEALKQSASLWGRPAGVPVYITRGILPGAYDLWIDREDAAYIWSRLMLKGEALGLAPVGRQAMELLRVDAGLSQEGSDYLGAFFATRAEDMVSPYDLGWGNRVDLAHGIFNGRAALRRIAGTPPRWIIRPVEFEASSAVSRRVMAGDKYAGLLTSMAYSPLRGKYVAMARVLPAYQDVSPLSVSSEDGARVLLSSATDLLRSSVQSPESR